MRMQTGNGRSIKKFRARAHPGRTCGLFNQQAKKLVARLAASLTRSPGNKTPTTESATSVKHTWIISSPKRCSFVASGPPMVSAFVDLRFVPQASDTFGLVWSYM